MSLLQPVLELMCAELQLRFYYHQGEYANLDEVYRLLTKCSNTPDILLRKLIETGVIEASDKPNVVVIK